MTNTKTISNMNSHDDPVTRLTQIGVALSAEKDINRLLEKILAEARALTNADGGTLYLMSENSEELHFAIVQNESLNLNMGGTGRKMDLAFCKINVQKRGA